MASPGAAVPTAPQQPLRWGIGIFALCFYIWAIHSYKLSFSDVAPILLIVGVLARGESIRIPAPLGIFGLFVVWASFGMSVSAAAPTTWGSVQVLAKLWVILFCVMNIVRTAAELRVVIIAWLGFFALYPVRGAFYNQYICQCTELGRVAWNFIFANPNDLAAFSLPLLGLAAGLIYVERVRIWRLAALAGVGVLALLIMLTQSRGAMLALGGATIFLVLNSRRRGRDTLLLVGLFAVAALFAPKDVWDRLGGLSNVSVESGMKGVDPEGSAASRWTIWQVAATTVRENPVLGVGAGMMPFHHRNFAMNQNLNFNVQGARDTHSTYLRIAAETGIPGLIIYLAVWGALFRHVRRVRRQLRHVRHREHQLLLFIELSMMAFAVAAIFGTYGTLAFTYLMLGVSWLAATVLEKEPWYVPANAGGSIAGPAPAVPSATASGSRRVGRQAAR
jgi:O-antigen ligase